MPARQINHATTAKPTTDASGNFPGFEELFAWQATGLTNGARDLVKQVVTWEEESFLLG